MWLTSYRLRTRNADEFEGLERWMGPMGLGVGGTAFHCPVAVSRIGPSGSSYRFISAFDGTHSDEVILSPSFVPVARTVPTGSSITEWAKRQTDTRQGSTFLLIFFTRCFRSR